MHHTNAGRESTVSERTVVMRRFLELECNCPFRLECTNDTVDHLLVNGVNFMRRESSLLVLNDGPIHFIRGMQCNVRAKTLSVAKPFRDGYIVVRRRPRTPAHYHRGLRKLKLLLHTFKEFGLKNPEIVKKVMHRD